MSKKYKTAVFIGRFQPIHNAHMEIIKKGLEIADNLVVVVGSSNKPPTIKNPWDSEQRIDIIKKAILEEYDEPINKKWSDFTKPSILHRVSFVTTRDYLYNDYKWSTEVYSKAIDKVATENKETVLLGCMKDDSSYYLKMFPQWDLHKMPYLWNLDSTDLRKGLFERGSFKKDDKIPNIVAEQAKRWKGLNKDKFNDLVGEYEHYKNYHKKWEKAPYPPTFNTVDALVIKSGNVLLIKRGFRPGKGLWALPGGFLDNSQRIKDSALRELKEETRIRVPKKELDKNIADMEIFDHPQRSLRGRTITYAYLIDLGNGPLPKVKADSDAEGAFWLPMVDVYKGENKFFEDHHSIIVKLTSNY